MTRPIKAAIRATAPHVRQSFREGTPNRTIAQSLVAFDALALYGYPEELADLRALADPVGFATRVLDEE